VSRGDKLGVNVPVSAHPHSYRMSHFTPMKLARTLSFRFSTKIPRRENESAHAAVRKNAAQM
jgi:hypothetical protein